MPSNLECLEYKIPGHTTFEYRLEVPLDYGGLLSVFSLSETELAALPEKITIFAREIVRNGQEKAPRLLYLEGGPGRAAPRPEPLTGWLDMLLNQYRVVLLDERGTGASHPLSAPIITSVGSPRLQAAYVSCFRQDSIVQDAESLRRALQGDEPWLALGQSFGSFCLTRYLAAAPEGLRGAIMLAGLPALQAELSDIHRHTWTLTEERNQRFFSRYPQDAKICQEIAAHLAEIPEYLPTGERLTPRRFRMLGNSLGWSYGLERVHHRLESPFQKIAGRKRLSPRFLQQVGARLAGGKEPLYWVLREFIYARPGHPTNWAAEKVRAEFPQFQLADIAAGAAGERELAASLTSYTGNFRFSGEQSFSWQGEEDPALRPLAPMMQELTSCPNFPQLYDPAVLAENKVPALSWLYGDDMYVPLDLARESAQLIGKLRVIESPDFSHDAFMTQPQNMIPRLQNEIEQLLS